MVKRGSRKSKVLYSPHTTPAIVEPPYRTNSNMSCQEILNYMETIQPKEKEKDKFMSSLTDQQLDELTEAIKAANISRGHDLSHLSAEALGHFGDELIKSYKLIPLRTSNSASGKRNKKRSTRHKKRRGKKTRKY